ncbi:GNAT family N-acetyltransferase [Kineococcus endophyticus]|uniref:GNAT family N-acetyltransferase n=1 Tax=Kineococcus endophyticus TaxID=1181883 RepID=A0ABV3P3R2_9ACTN
MLPALTLRSTSSTDPVRGAWAQDHFDRWYDALAAAEALDRPDPSTWRRGELRALLERGSSDERMHVLLAEENGDVVGVADVRCSLADNRHVAVVHVAVPPAHRRRGVGSALLAAALEVAAAEGRTTVRVRVDRPAERDPRSWPGSVAAARWGFGAGLLTARRQLPLPPAADRLAALEAATAPHATGYRVRAYAGPVPEADLEEMARLTARMSTDAPNGDLAVEPEHWDAERIREVEAVRVAQGRHQWLAVAQDVQGHLVAYTVLVRSDHEPERLIQLDTLVLAEHRGHRLGTLVKLACLRRALVDNPAAQRVSTWNAVSNAPMVAVNEALGFVLDEFLEELEAPLDRVVQTLRNRT